MSRGAPQHLVVADQKNTRYSVSIREHATYPGVTNKLSQRLFRPSSTGFPSVLDKNSAGFYTGERRVIPEQISGFSTRFTTGFRMINQQCANILFHQLLIAFASRLGRNVKGEKEAESASCGKRGRLLPVGVPGAYAHTMWHVEQFTGDRANSRRSRRRRRMSRHRPAAARFPRLMVSARKSRRVAARRRWG